MKEVEIIRRAGKFGIRLDGKSVFERAILTINELEENGYDFERAESTFELLLRELTGEFKSFFKLGNYRVLNEKDGNKPSRSRAITKIHVDGEEEITSEDGSGPVSVLDNSLRKALIRFFPAMAGVILKDFKVRIVDGSRSTDAMVVVYMESLFDNVLIKTMGVSPDIIEASWMALK